MITCQMDGALSLQGGDMEQQMLGPQPLASGLQGQTRGFKLPPRQPVWGVAGLIITALQNRLWALAPEPFRAMGI
jgi:hypothetical protein